MTPNRSSRIPTGWIRAVLLLITHALLSRALAAFTDSLALWLFMSAILAVALVALFRWFLDHRSFASTGLTRAFWTRQLAGGILFACILLAVGAILMYALNLVRWSAFRFQPEDLLFQAFLLSSLAFGEELLFRGYVLRHFEKSWGPWPALIVSSLIFAWVHSANEGASILGWINVALGGLFLGIAYLHTGSLWFPFGFHFAWNYVQGPLLGFPVSGYPFDSLLHMEPRGAAFLHGGSFGFEGSFVCTILLAVSVVYAGLLYGKQS